MPMRSTAPAVPSDFLERIHAYAERSAHALQLFSDAGT